MPASDPLDLFRPFFWLAIFGFLVGFSSYLLAGALAGPQVRDRAPVTAQAGPTLTANTASASYDVLRRI